MEHALAFSDRCGIDYRGADCADEFCLNSVRYPNRSSGMPERQNDDGNQDDNRNDKNADPLQSVETSIFRFALLERCWHRYLRIYRAEFGTTWPPRLGLGFSAARNSQRRTLMHRCRYRIGQIIA